MTSSENGKSSQNRLIWIDMEMTGLDPDTDRVIEIATIVTDADLEVVEVGPVVAIHQNETILGAMDDWNQQHHGESGLIDRVRKSALNERDGEKETLAFLKSHVAKGVSPLCGNSVGQDRRFLFNYMKELEAYFHYRIIDVSSVKELAKRWYPHLPKFEKQKSHTALEDIKESIEELKYFRKRIFISGS
jgi:oligoribonuclease